ncbi:DUF4148 domain-containing protein [Caenimonas soli]|uniref:DUF4148 domain-containing protein n=1 Tax=Caenimonas soli TaxID=2735555 RepID=UPI00155165B8|nr:DUF4148 domain-containing protein [Caenimonas soli]NPC56316.1 DUF4148 domain-containing protein [Caenimonas soli]
MNRNLATALRIAAIAAAAAAAMAAGNALADDITIEKTPFVSTLSRAEVRADLLKNSQVARELASEWSMQFNNLSPVRSAYSPAQARAAYAASRDEVRQLNGEDSGSMYFSMSRSNGTSTRVMGGSAH